MPKGTKELPEDSWVRGGGCNYFCSSRNFGEDGSNLTSTFFRWVVKNPRTRESFILVDLAMRVIFFTYTIGDMHNLKDA